MSTVEKFPRSIKPPVLVLGATDGLGTGLVEAGLEAGYPILAVGEDRELTEGLHERFAGHGKLSTLQGSVWTNADAAGLAGSLRELPLAPLVAIINIPVTCERGRLLQQDAEFLARVLQREVIPHMNAARHLLPLLAESGRRARYLVMGGPNGDTSWVGYGHHSVAAAATRMLVRALRRETEDTPVRVQQLVVGKPVRTEQNKRCACPEWPDAVSVGRYAVKVLTDSDTNDAVVRYQSTLSSTFSESPVDPGPGRTISS
jgi:NAD(P)-dependent dehydrogenase (short-subunit alcohol dehydrogenase family)